jgi:protein-tyrosine phosphatase
MIRVLFVCLGNICRSPMAEAIFAHLVEKAGLQNEIECDSAGTGGWHIGAPAHHGTMQVLRKAGIAYSGRGRQISANDLDVFDYIITMDNENLANVHAMIKPGKMPRAQIMPLLEYSRLARDNHIREVPDPYLVGGFDITFRLIESGCEGLLEEIRRAHSL